MAVRGILDSKHLSVSQVLDMKPGDTSPQNTSPGHPIADRSNQKSEHRKREKVTGGGVKKITKNSQSSRSSACFSERELY